MTKEELEKEAEEKYVEVDREFIACQDEGEVFNIGYILGAEPREKRIAELEEENERFKGDLELWESGACRATNLNKCEVVKELKAQIEKMKADVKQGQSYWNSGEMQYDLYQRLLDKWEIK